MAENPQNVFEIQNPPNFVDIGASSIFCRLHRSWWILSVLVFLQTLLERALSCIDSNSSLINARREQPMCKPFRILCQNCFQGNGSLHHTTNLFEIRLTTFLFLLFTLPFSERNKALLGYAWYWRGSLNLNIISIKLCRKMERKESFKTIIYAIKLVKMAWNESFKGQVYVWVFSFQAIFTNLLFVLSKKVATV